MCLSLAPPGPSLGRLNSDSSLIPHKFVESVVSRGERISSRFRSVELRGIYDLVHLLQKDLLARFANGTHVCPVNFR